MVSQNVADHHFSCSCGNLVQRTSFRIKINYVYTHILCPFSHMYDGPLNSQECKVNMKAQTELNQEPVHK